MTDADCARILIGARSFNEEQGVTGLLIYIDNGTFVQIFEGEHDAVESALERVLADLRHFGISMLFDTPVEQRLFGDWAMAFRPMRPVEFATMSGFSGLNGKSDIQKFLQNPSSVTSAMRSIALANERGT